MTLIVHVYESGVYVLFTGTMIELRKIYKLVAISLSLSQSLSPPPSHSSTLWRTPRCQAQPKHLELLQKPQAVLLQTRPISRFQTHLTKPRPPEHAVSPITTNNMAARLLSSLTARTLSRPTPSAIIRNARSFQSTARLMETPTAVLPVRKPVGAFRGR